MEAQNIFDECFNDTKYNVPVNKIKEKVEELVNNIEADYKGDVIDNASFDREKEKNELNKKIKEAENKISALKIPKNVGPRRAEISKNLSIRRDKYRKEIAIHKIRLSEIDMETNSSQPDSKEKLSKREMLSEKVKQKNESSTPVQKQQWGSVNPYEDI